MKIDIENQFHETHINQVRELISKREFEIAKAICKQINSTQENANALHFLGYMAQQEGDFKEAVKLLQRAKRLGLADWSCDLMLGLSLQKLGQKKQSLAAAKAAHLQAPLDKDAANLLLEQTLSVHGTRKAKILYKTLLKTISDSTFINNWENVFPEPNPIKVIYEDPPPSEFCKRLADELSASSSNRHQNNLSIDIDDYNTIKYRHADYDRSFVELLNDKNISFNTKIKNWNNILAFAFQKRKIYEKISLEFKDISYLYEILEDEGSKKLLIQLCAFRVFGHLRIKLPLNDHNFDAHYSQTDRYVVARNQISVGYMDANLDKFEIEGHHVYATKPGFCCAYLQKQYEFHLNNISIKAEVGDYIIDAGMCWGETSVYFANQTGSTGKVFGFEFVPSNLTVAKSNVSLNSNFDSIIDIVTSPLWSESRLKLYYVDWGPGSRVSSDEKRYKYDGTCDTITIDDFVQKNKVSKIDFIKMDIEGAELDSLKGAEGVIRKFKPKLAISIYHSLPDFSTIPRFINELDLGYKFYLGHHTIYQNETVLFGVAN